MRVYVCAHICMCVNDVYTCISMSMSVRVCTNDFDPFLYLMFVDVYLENAREEKRSFIKVYLVIRKNFTSLVL